MVNVVRILELQLFSGYWALPAEIKKRSEASASEKAIEPFDIYFFAVNSN